MKAARLTVTLAATAGLVAALVAPASAASTDRPFPNERPGTLSGAAPEGLVLGTAVAGGGHHLEQDYPDPFLNDDEYRDVLARQFTSVSPENQMKWEYLRPTQDTYDFDVADAIVEFAEENNQVVRGHTLLWHSQNPDWLEEGDFTDDELRAILKDHIDTVVGRYAGRIQQWDVANEIFLDDGSLRSEENIWIRELGIGIVADAFRWTHEADPEAALFFNDFNVEGINPKSTAYYTYVQELLADGVPVDGFSTQGHLSTRFGFPGNMTENLQRFDDLGLETAVTEVDVRIPVAAGQRPTAAQLAQQSDYYVRMLEACLAVEGCGSFTIWGFVDTYSWVPVFFAGESSATLLFEDYTRKPAFNALRTTLAEAAREQDPRTRR